MSYQFSTWDDALRFFTREIWPLHDRRYLELTLNDAFDIWAENEKIKVQEARDTQDSDDYDNLTKHR